jgi:hypothetical protein
MTVRALTGVFEIPHPGYLMYKAFDKKRRTILVPTLGLMREEPAPPPEKPREDTVEGLRKLVLKDAAEGVRGAKGVWGRPERAGAVASPKRLDRSRARRPGAV